MATSKDRLGDAIVNRLIADGFYPSTTPAHVAHSRLVWKAIADEILKELKNNQDIVLLAADISVNPGTFKDQDANLPITGVGVNQAVTLSGKTQ